MTRRHIAALGLLALVWAAPLAAQQQAAPRALLASGQRIAQAPPPPRWPQDPGDALYRSARQALNDGDNARAARLFQQIRQRHPNSRYTPDALYWEAFARYRVGGPAELRTALGALDTQRQRYPRASTRGDADQLATRIQGELARRGDQQAAQRLEERADRNAQQQQCPGEDSDAIAALNGLLHMGSDRALPLLRRVLARRDACAAPLREKAVFLVAQMDTPEAEQLLMELARSDASRTVREQAVFWMSQGGSESSLRFLQETIEGSGDVEMKEKAVFALSQHSSPRAAALLRGYAERAGTPAKVREQAIFWLGQKGGAENAEFLRSLFRRTTEAALKEKLLFSLSQMEGGGRWLLGVVDDAQQPVEVRKQALFWAAQNSDVAELMGLYGRLRERELKEQVIFGLAQSDDRAAVDRLIDIARRDPDRELRQKALFWLGQSSDPRATRVIEEIVNQ